MSRFTHDRTDELAHTWAYQQGNVAYSGVVALSPRYAEKLDPRGVYSQWVCNCGASKWVQQDGDVNYALPKENQL